jgi:DNA-binding response OmpR family regulator
LLLVEDHDDSRNIMARLLRQHFEVVTAASYDAALAACDATPPDLVVTDISLGGDRDGVELLTTIRQRLPIPGIAITGFQIQDPQRLRDAGFAHWFMKPIHFHELIAALKEVFADGADAETSQPANVPQSDSRR